MEVNDMRINELNASRKEFLFVDNGIKLEIQGSPDISFQFNDGVKMIILANNAIAYLKTSQSIFNIMEKYANFIENDRFTTLIVETDEEKL
uniref:Uncharacterized protein n=1 Tax=Romanomermis culicivorax TaxID=13658 RepID=A0A915I6B0_ROMCU